MSRAWSLILLLISVSSAFAEAPTPIENPLYAFPSVHPGPASARSAGLALAERWLGDDPFENPAWAGGRRVSMTGGFLRVSRQDLRADSRHFSDETGFLEIEGGYLGFTRGRLGLAAYAHQPVMRFENNAFEVGELGAPAPPAQVQSTSSVRELRLGLASSYGLGRARVGLAGEWTRREDDYFYNEESGSPNMGTREVLFDGTSIGAQAGASAVWDLGRSEGLVVGGAVRYLPALDLTGKQDLAILSDTSLTDVSVTRASGWEAGVSARWSASDAFRVYFGMGGETARAWRGFGIESGRSGTVSIAGALHDPRDPWTVRIGIGRESQRGATETRASMMGIGFGWRSGTIEADLGVLRRGLERANHPTSFDDRVLVDVTVHL